MPQNPIILRLSPSATPPTKDRCRVHDSDVGGCDAAPGCAYYFCSQTCRERGTSNRIACAGSTSSAITPLVGGYSREFASFYWGTVVGGGLVLAGVVAAVLMKFFLSPHPKNLLKGYVDATYGAIQGKSVPLYDALVGVMTNIALTITAVNLLSLTLNAFMGEPIEFARKANFIAWRLPIMLATPFVYLYLWKRYFMPGVFEERRKQKYAREALRTYVVLTIAITTSVMLLFAAKLFYLFLLWGFNAPNFDPLQTSRPFSYVFVTLPIAAIHMVLLRKLKGDSREEPQKLSR